MEQIYYENTCEMNAKTKTKIYWSISTWGRVLCAVVLILMNFFAFLGLYSFFAIDLFVIGIVCNVMWIYSDSEKISRRIHGNFIAQKTYFYDSSFCVENSAYHASIWMNYGSVRKIKKTKQYFVLYMNGNVSGSAAVILDRNAFSRGQEEYFLGFLKQRIQMYRNTAQKAHWIPIKNSPQISEEEIHYQYSCTYTLKQYIPIIMRTNIIFECVFIIVFGVLNIDLVFHGANVISVVGNIGVNLFIMVFAIWYTAVKMEKSFKISYGELYRAKYFLTDSGIVEVMETTGGWHNIAYDCVTSVAERKDSYLVKLGKANYLMMEKNGTQDAQMREYLQKKGVKVK